MDPAFLYANRLRVVGPTIRISSRPGTRSLSPAREAFGARLIELRERVGSAVWPLDDLIELLADTMTTASVKSHVKLTVGRTPGSGAWPTYQRVRMGFYRFVVPISRSEIARHERTVTTCRDEVITAIQAVVSRSHSSEFKWEEIWMEMRDRETTYTRDSVRVMVTQHLVEGHPSSRTLRHDDLVRVRRGVYRLKGSTAVPAGTLQPAPTSDKPTSSRRQAARMTLTCAWCGLTFERERRLVHPGPTYCCRSHQVSATGARRRGAREPDHGTYGRYRKGCHCDLCRAANTARCRRNRGG